MSDELNGKLFGQYQIESTLGSGPLGTVYRAQQTSANRTVALKVFPSSFLADGDFLQRFTQEVRVIGRLEHYHILPQYDVGEINGRPYIAMRYMRHGSLERRLTGPMALVAAGSLTQQIAAALEHAHNRGVIHRNLAPGNVLFDGDSNAYLADFSIKSIREAQAELTGASFTGHPGYVAPEIASGERVLTPAVDIYALGVLLFEMVTGQLPFMADSPMAQVMMHVSEEVPSPLSMNDALPGALETVIMKALAKRPADRYDTPNQLARAFIKAADVQVDAVRSTIATQVLENIQKEQNVAPGAVTPAEGMIPDEAGSLSKRDRRRFERKQARMERRLRGRSGPAWYLVLLVLVMLIGAWLGVGTMVGNEFRRQAESATQVAVNATATQVAQSTVDSIEAAAQATAAVEQTATQQALIAAATAGAESAATETPTPTPTLTPAAQGEVVIPGGQALGGSGGSLVLMSDADGDQEIYQLDLATLELRQLTENTVLDGGPTWSPDGRLIAYHSEDTPEGTHIFTLDPETGDRVDLTSGIRTDLWPLWSPDGEQIAYFYNDGSRSWINLVTLGGENVEAAQLPRSDLRPFAWSLDQQFVYTLGLGSEAALEILQVDLTTQERQPVTQLRGATEFIDYSPDRQLVVFAALLLSTGTREIFIADAVCDEPLTLATCNARQLTSDGFMYFQPRFSPDGTLLVVASNRSGNRDLWLMDLDGTILQQLTDLPSDESNPAWQPPVGE